jgi:hypothetical protein
MNRFSNLSAFTMPSAANAKNRQPPHPFTKVTSADSTQDIDQNQPGYLAVQFFPPDILN